MKLFTINKEEKFVFKKIFDFANKENLMFRWGSKGFSLNLPFDNGFVGLCFGYPPTSVFKQSIYTGFEEMKETHNKALHLTFFHYCSKMQVNSVEDRVFWRVKL